MDRAELLKQIATLDRQINAEVAKNPIKSLNPNYRSFPWGNWVGGVFFVALGIFAPQISRDMGVKYGNYIVYFGIFCLVSAFFRTIMYFLKGRAKTDKAYSAGMGKVQELQQQKKALQDALAKAQ
ncbi:hypothetical protein BH09SUM1_BH09SUM1_06720 [soil metagenome]